MSTVIIGCKLPQGIIVKNSKGQDMLLNGMNTALVAGGYGLTHVDEDEAAMFFVTYADFAPVKSNAIFTHHTNKISDIIDLGDELKDERTGFEGLDPSKPAPGLKAEDKQVLSQKGLEHRAVKAPQSKADKKAAAELAAATNGAV